jgi:FkbM family methyltransferase
MSLKSSINQMLDRLGIHVTIDTDPALAFAQRRFVDDSFDCSAVLAEQCIIRGRLSKIVQIGANDGLHNDSVTPLILKFGLRAVLVEPQPQAAASLREIHEKNPSVSVAESAVAEQVGTLRMWRAVGVFQRGKSKPDAWTSADRNHVERHLQVSGLGGTVEPFDVPAFPLSHILNEHSMPDPEMIFIDAEKMDRVILDQVELREDGPLFIQFEASNLHSSDLFHIHSRLKARGYQFVCTGRDIVCIHPKLAIEIQTITQ